MDEKKLPKLEIEGFQTVTKAPAQSKWRRTAADFVRRAGLSVKKAPAPQDEDAGYRRLLIKTGVCAAIAIIILAISSIHSPVTNDITQALGETVNHEFDIDEDIGRLKFVQTLNEETQSVFSTLPETAVVYPAAGQVIQSFGEGGSKGVRIVPISEQIVCIAKGTVTSVGKTDESGYVKIQLDSGELVMLYNLTPIVQVKDIVMPGQPLGDVVGDYLYFEIKSGDDYVDPIKFIQQRAALSS